MSYDNMGNILTKKQDVKQTGVQFAGNLKAGYDLSYSYVNNPQQISNIADVSYRYADGDSVPAQTKSQNWHYDANGNLLLVNTGVKNTDEKLQKQNERKLLWDEENRLLALSDNGNVSTYWYDAAGERTVKCSGENQSVYVNGALSGSNTSNTNFTAYINPYLVLNNGGYYSKHIYMGTERILSKLNSSDVFEKSPIAEPKAGSTVDYRLKYLKLLSQIRQRYDSLGVIYIHPQNGGEGLVTPESGRIKQPTPAYYYHSDHLGSSSLLSDNDGNVSQHIEYLPFGEVFVEERNNNWNTPYKFNAKELDEETGLYYYGARYFDSRTSVWYGVDPLGEKKPWLTPYHYCSNNPINRLDPDGQDDYGLDANTKRLSLVKPTNDETDFVSTGSFNDKGEFTPNDKPNSVIELSKGTLNAQDKQQDLSKTGFTTTGGKQEGGVDLMDFISSQTKTELAGLGFETPDGKSELLVGSWDKNNGYQSITPPFNVKGTVQFDIHTHPILDEFTGKGVAGSGDFKTKSKYPAYYILSGHNGITQYFPNPKTVINGEEDRIKHTKYPLRNTLPNSLKKHFRGN